MTRVEISQSVLLQAIQSTSFGLVIFNQNMQMVWANDYTQKLLSTQRGENILDYLNDTHEFQPERHINLSFKLRDSPFLGYFASANTPDKSYVLVIFPESENCSKDRESTPLKEGRNNGLIFISRGMKNVYNLAMKAANVQTNVLITGETGVGKSTVAKMIHNLSPRKNGPFITINCGNIPPTLLESELFGYENGTFTGADRHGRQGLLESGNNGTVFLDEIAEIPVNLQVKLLDAIENKKITRIGGRRTIELNIRIIAATNRDLHRYVQEGNFRMDLFYRLNIISIVIPPLRECSGDISVLTEHILNEANQKYNVKKYLDNCIKKCFENYSWPGNIRELKNVIEQMVIVTQTETITLNDLPNHIKTILPDRYSTKDKLYLANEMQSIEKGLIIQALKENRGLRKAARQLGISHSTLLRKLNKIGMKWHEICE